MYGCLFQLIHLIFFQLPDVNGKVCTFLLDQFLSVDPWFLYLSLKHFSQVRQFLFVDGFETALKTKHSERQFSSNRQTDFCQQLPVLLVFAFGFSSAFELCF